ncbi:uncharacterized protein EI90DRAFT_3017858 [Cantharellus anzutake]|uniref:uncharacterized protein n=1 Tax=Cantharellus anzutake TaxID=1750568 RepID=UPI0019042D64|nr:uncharacterized protein EI90DRAFT_3017858 [Cantharellus anzutake]KAF8328230.1 hypothetical protein EI90DRAFT_3017858 [Cantharellus anzutake]
MPPPIQLFLTTIVSQPKLRQRQEYILRILQVKKIPYISYDLASDENAKRLWRRKALQEIRIFPTFDKFEEAVEYNELNLFLRLDEDWDEAIDGKTLEAQPAIGVPGVVTPEKITGQKPSFAPAGSVPIPAVREGEVDLGEVLEGYGLQGVKITPDEITDLVQMLGLNDEESKDLIGGLDFSVPKPATPSTTDTAPSSHPGQKSHSSTPSKRPPTSIDTSALQLKTLNTNSFKSLMKRTMARRVTIQDLTNPQIQLFLDSSGNARIDDLCNPH